ncbi:hypothetical protein [Helicobacter sp. T3_23-1056]
MFRFVCFGLPRICYADSRNDENLIFCHSERNERSECSEESKSHGVLFLDSRGLDTSLQATLFAQYDNKSVDCFAPSQ